MYSICLFMTADEINWLDHSNQQNTTTKNESKCLLLLMMFFFFNIKMIDSTYD